MQTGKSLVQIYRKEHILLDRFWNPRPTLHQTKTIIVTVTVSSFVKKNKKKKTNKNLEK